MGMPREIRPTILRRPPPAAPPGGRSPAAPQRRRGRDPPPSRGVGGGGVRGRTGGRPRLFGVGQCCFVAMAGPPFPGVRPRPGAGARGRAGAPAGPAGGAAAAPSGAASRPRLREPPPSGGVGGGTAGFPGFRFFFGDGAAVVSIGAGKRVLVSPSGPPGDALPACGGGRAAGAFRGVALARPAGRRGAPVGPLAEVTMVRLYASFDAPPRHLTFLLIILGLSLDYASRRGAGQHAP
eukprot:gene22704-biopygen2768